MKRNGKKWKNETNQDILNSTGLKEWNNEKHQIKEKHQKLAKRWN